MTNGDFYRQANDRTLAALLAAVCANLLTQLGMEVSDKQVESEIDGFYYYLKEPIVEGDYLN